MPKTRVRVLAAALIALLSLSLACSDGSLADPLAVPSRVTPSAPPLPNTPSPPTLHPSFLEQLELQLRLLRGGTTMATGQKIVYVVVQPSSDAANQLLYAATLSLQALTPEVAVIPRADWSVNDLQTQCTATNAGRGYLGAIVLQGAVGVSGTENYFFLQRGWSRVRALAEVWKCERTDSNFPDAPTASISIIRQPIIVDGFGNSNGATLYPEAGLATYYLSNGIEAGRVAVIIGSVFAEAYGVTIPSVNAQAILHKAIRSFVRGFVPSVGSVFCQGLLNKNLQVMTASDVEARARMFVSQYVTLTPEQSDELDKVITAAFSGSPQPQSVGCV